MSTTGPEAGKEESDVFVCVPSFNHAAYLEKCLRSIIAQTAAPRKLLVIDDGSTDGSAAVAERVLKDCPFGSELISRENRGLCRTLNQAFALSEGRYFAYLGSDDFWLPHLLAARRSVLDSRDSAVLAYGHAYLVDEAGEAFDSTANYSESWGNYPDGNARPMLLDGGAPISSTVVYRRSSLADVSWNEGSRLEDYEMYLKLMDRGDFAFDPRILSAWRRHEKNTSANRLMMLNEVLAAHKRNLGRPGADSAELASIQRRIKFVYARMELQHGNRSGALKLASDSWRGAASTWQLLKFYLRAMVPMSIVDRRRRARSKREPEELGS